ncbi:MAG: hypothetical protein AAB864_00310 [Patescibacteria group bacterium]
MFRRLTWTIAFVLALAGCGGSPTAVPMPSPTPTRPFACRPPTQTIPLNWDAYLVATYQDQNPDPNLVAVLDPIWDVSDGGGRGERIYDDQPWLIVVRYFRTGTFTVRLTRQGDPTQVHNCTVVVTAPF